MAILILTHFSSIIEQVSIKLLKDFRYEFISIVFLFSLSFSSEFMKINNKWLIKDLQNIIIVRYINLIYKIK